VLSRNLRSELAAIELAAIILTSRPDMVRRHLNLVQFNGNAHNALYCFPHSHFSTYMPSKKSRHNYARDPAGVD